MFYQVADSDTTFIVAIAIIAGIVVVFMAIATLILRRSEHKKDKPVPPIDQPQSIPSVAIMVASPPRESEEGALPSVPSVAIATAFAQVEGSKDDLPSDALIEITVALSRKERPEGALPPAPSIEAVAASPQEESEKHDSPSISPVKTTAASPTEERPKLRFEFSPITKEMLWGIPLMAVLMSACIFGLFYAYVKARMLPGFWDPYGLGFLNLLLAGTALGGCIGLRVVRLSWRQVVIASLLAGAILLIFARLQPSYTFPGDLGTLIFVAGGVFFLPLLDPAVRRNGPAPSHWKVALAAFILSILVIRSTVFHSPLGGFIALLLAMGIVLGLLLSLSKKAKNVSDGAWVGALSVLLTLLLVAMLLSGFRV